MSYSYFNKNDMPVSNGRDPLCASSVGRHDACVRPLWDLFLDPLQDGRIGVQVVDRNVKEPLYLRGVKVHGDDMIGARHREHVGHELGRDGRTALVLLVLPRVRVAGDDCSDALGRRGLARIDHDAQLHQVVIDLATAGLEDVDILATDGLFNFDANEEQKLEIVFLII